MMQCSFKIFSNSLNDILDAVPILNITVAIFAIYAVYWYITPKNVVKDLSVVGYDHLFEEARVKRINKPKTDIIAEYRKKRVVGSVPPVFPNGWFALLDSSDVAVKQVRHVTALGEQFAVFRGEDEEIHIVNAVCPHLGANIAVGGIVNGSCIQCPFHGWMFNGKSGNCELIPYSKHIPAEAKLKRWFSCEVNTMIFVWYHAENEEPTWHPEIIPNIHNGRWWYRGRNEHYVNAHIQELPENGADITHLPVLHGPAMFGGSDLFKMRKWWCSLANHHWKASWTPQNKGGEKHIASMQLYTETVFFNKFSLFSMNVRSDQVGPGYVIMNVETFSGPVVILQTVTPLEPLLQKVVHKVFYPFRSSLYGTLMFFSESILFERDVIIWNHKKYEEKPLLTKEENTIAKHRRWYSQFYSKNSPKYQKYQLQW